MRFVLLFAIIVSFIGISCSNFDFNNPVDPSFKLASPGELYYGSFTENAIELKWVYDSNNISEIEIEQSTDNFSYTQIMTVKSDVKSVVISGSFLTSKTYFFRIRGKADNNYSAYSRALSVMLLMLDAPYNLAVTSITETAVSLQWMNNYKETSSFDIEMSKDSVNYSAVKNVPAASTNTIPSYSTVIEGKYLTTEKYFFRVRGKTKLNSTNYSNIVSARLEFNAPTNLTVISLSETSVVLKWQDNSSFETGFDVEYSTDGVNYRFLTTAPANTNNFNYTGNFPINNTYYFRVKAKTDINATAYSNTASMALMFDAPSNLSVSSISETTVQLTWKDNSSFETGFVIEKTTPAGVSATPIQVPANQNYYTDNSLVKTAAYSYRVKAITANSSTAYSPSVKISYSTQGGTLARTLAGHIEEVRSVCFSPDGLRLASASKDNSIRIWNVSDGSWMNTLPCKSRVYSVAFSPDGQYIASGSADNTVKIWKASTGDLIYNLAGHSGTVTSVSFNRDGSLIASGSSDSTVKIWRMKDGSLAQTFKQHTNTVNTVCFSPDGLYLASGSDDNTARVWDLSSGTCRVTLNTMQSVINSVVYSPDGHYIACSSGDNVVWLWNASYNLPERKVTALSNVFSLAFSPDGQFIAGGLRDNSVQVWRTSDLGNVYALTSHTGSVWAVNFSPDGQYVASGSTDTFVKLWKVGSGWIVVP